MQESLYNTVQKLQIDEKINVEELEAILDSDIEEVVTLCKKACLKPKTDSMGNAYFTKRDVDLLKKIKELYSKSTENVTPPVEDIISTIEHAVSPDLSSNSKLNFLTKAKNRVKTDSPMPFNSSFHAVEYQNQLEKMENNLVNKISEILSEKMDGFDEIIVELIRAKTENENLRHKVNSLNKQLYILKDELASYTPLPFGLYVKKDSEEY